MLLPPEKPNSSGNQDRNNKPAKSTAAFFAAGMKCLEIGLARHEWSFVFQIKGFKSFSSFIVTLVLKF
jgi:hypothetical protein